MTPRSLTGSRVATTKESHFLFIHSPEPASWFKRFELGWSWFSHLRDTMKASGNKAWFGYFMKFVCEMHLIAQLHFVLFKCAPKLCFRELYILQQMIVHRRFSEHDFRVLKGKWSEIFLKRDFLKACQTSLLEKIG